MSTETQEVAEQSATVELDNEKTEAQNTPAETAASGEVEKKQDEPVKTFTQAEVDALVQKRLVKESRRVERNLREQLAQQAAQVEPRRETFQDDEAFLQAKIDHLAEQRAAQKLAEREKAQEAEKRTEAFYEKAEKATERYPDFNAVVANPDLKINEGMVEFISDSDLGADVAYFLGKNPIKAAQIAEMSPIKAARALTQIESELAARPKANPSKAPEPITPINSRGKSQASSAPSDDDDIDTWMKKERERVMRSR